MEGSGWVKQVRLWLQPSQAAELRELARYAPQAYVRERAEALLALARGHWVAQVARDWCYRPRRPETVAEWLTRYREHGVAGLTIRAGRGRKPAFSPCLPHGGGGTRGAAAGGAALAAAVGLRADPLDAAPPAGGV